jgi:hypothetical protein
VMKLEFHLDFSAAEQHTPGYFFLQGTSPGFSPPVSRASSMGQRSPSVGEPAWLGQTKASCGCPPPNNFFSHTTSHTNPAKMRFYLMVSTQSWLVRDGWCWWYRKCAPSDTVLERLENEARETKKGLWANPQPVPPWEWRKRK